MMRAREQDVGREGCMKRVASMKVKAFGLISAGGALLIAFDTSRPPIDLWSKWASLVFILPGVYLWFRSRRLGRSVGNE